MPEDSDNSIMWLRLYKKANGTYWLNNGALWRGSVQNSWLDQISFGGILPNKSENELWGRTLWVRKYMSAGWRSRTRNHRQNGLSYVGTLYVCKQKWVRLSWQLLEIGHKRKHFFLRYLINLRHWTSLVARRATYVVDGRFFSHFLVARRTTYVVDGRFFGHFFWKVEGSSAHTRESRAAHVWH